MLLKKTGRFVKISGPPERNEHKMRPKVSIGLPVHNGESYVEEAINSMLDQTYGDLELIITDNASTDRTEEICRDYLNSDSRVLYFRSETNKGASWNFNRAFHLSRGKYFKWASYDDLCADTFLERCVEVLDREDSVVLAYAQIAFIDERSEPIDIRRPFMKNGSSHLKAKNPHKRLRWLFLCPPFDNAFFGLIRVDALKKTRVTLPFPLSDLSTLAELILQGKFYEISEKLFYRRIHPLISRRPDASNRDIALWFDPQYSGSGHLDALTMLFFSYCSGIHRTPMNKTDKTLCFLQLPFSFIYISAFAADGVLRLFRMRERVERARFFPIGQEK